MTDSTVAPPKESKTRKRSMTSLTLTWFAERMRKAAEIREKISSGSYQVPSDKIAASLVNGKGLKE